jgi:protein-L-isoaspartate O-methyltransferase
MVEKLVALGSLKSDAWRDAFIAVGREPYVPEFSVRMADGILDYTADYPGWLSLVYSDKPLLTQVDVAGRVRSSSTQPSIMAAMLEALDVEDGHRVLEVGTGTGYGAALLAHRVGSDRVVSIDIDPELVNLARGRLSKHGFLPKLVAGNGLLGCVEWAPYDRILATCGIGRIPNAWRAQTIPGSVIVACLGHGIIRLEADRYGGLSGNFLADSAAFIPARLSAADDTGPTDQELAASLLSWTGTTKEVVLAAPLDAPVPRFLASVAQPDVVELTLTGEGKSHHCLFQPSTVSWARMTLLDGQTAQVEHGGPRDLWSERSPLISHWAAANRPPASAYGLKVHPNGSHVLYLGTPDGPKWKLR